MQLHTLRYQVDIAAIDQQQSCLYHCVQCNHEILRCALATCVTTSCMQYVLANNQVLQVGWVGLREHMLGASFPDILCMEAVIAQKGTFVLQFSAPGVLKPHLCYPKKCPTIHQRSYRSSDRQTMSTQQTTSVCMLSCTQHLLLF